MKDTKLRIFKYGLAAAVVFLMAQISVWIDDKEFLFPEIAAVSIGALITEDSPWRVSKPRLWILMSLAAFCGIGIVRYVTVPLFFQVLIGLCFTALLLYFSKTTMVPVISATILPILLKTESLVYCASVMAMCAFILFLQWGLEKLHMKQPLVYKPVYQLGGKQARLWTKRIGIFMMFALLPILAGKLYFIAPPLIVTFVETTNINFRMREYPLRLFQLMAAAGMIGYLGKLSVLYLHVPVALGAVLAICLLFGAFELFHIQFPPAGATALLPFILPAENLWLYPVGVIVGAGGLIWLAMKCFRQKKYQIV